MIDTAKLEAKVQKSVDMLKSRSLISRLLIGLSGGKDSLCLCELVKMAEVTNVSYFNMEFLPDLQVQYDLLQYACQRFNIPYEQIIKVPSEHFCNCMHFSAYTWYSEQAKKDFPKTSRRMVFSYIAKKYKGTIVTGAKKCDSMAIERKINQNATVEMYPLVNWTLEDVLTFMELRNIKIPEQTKQGCRGVGLEDEDIMFIYNHYPEDFAKIEEIFPFVRAVLLKYKYFDVHKSLRLV